MLLAFGDILGLKINLKKSELLANQQQTQQLAQYLRCKWSSFPFKYLGLPFLDSKLEKEEFILLIQKINARLSGWT